MMATDLFLTLAIKFFQSQELPTLTALREKLVKSFGFELIFLEIWYTHISETICRVNFVFLANILQYVYICYTWKKTIILNAQVDITP